MPRMPSDAYRQCFPPKLRRPTTPEPTPPDLFPPNSITVAEATGKIAGILGAGGDGIRIERYVVEAVTEKGTTLKLKFDRTKVGQPNETDMEFALKKKG